MRLGNPLELNTMNYQKINMSWRNVRHGDEARDFHQVGLSVSSNVQAQEERRQ